MSRSGYTDDNDNDYVSFKNWRGVIASATRGKRGQAFFRALVRALDAMPIKRLIKGELELEGEVCALGAIGREQGKDMSGVETEDHDALGKLFDIAPQLTQEVMWENDEVCSSQTPEKRWVRMRAWAAEQIRVLPEELEESVPAVEQCLPIRFFPKGVR